ncbi:MAG TPA: hypothetical protein VIG74_00085 [Alphaproteobacteria bacterium]
MISVLGMKRVIGLTLLLLLNAGLAAGVYMYLMPQSEQLERETRSLRGQISMKLADSEKLRLEHQQIQDQKSRFEDLTAAGFFSDQNKVLARTKIEAVQKYSGVLSAAYNISPATTTSGIITEGTGHMLLDTPVSLTIEAMDDVDFFNFIYWVENGFPGHISVSSISMERALEVNDVTLRQIGSGVDTTLVKGKVSFNWRTLIPEPAASGTAGGGVNGM